MFEPTVVFSMLTQHGFTKLIPERKMLLQYPHFVISYSLQGKESTSCNHNLVNTATWVFCFNHLQCIQNGVVVLLLLDSKVAKHYPIILEPVPAANTTRAWFLISTAGITFFPYGKILVMLFAN
jgi:hypothetical protein